MIIVGDCLDEMRKMESNSISCIVTDPPYGLGFMGKKWDAGVPHAEIWNEALRVVKPGGHILAFGGTRTYHRLTCAIEDAGWEIRDCLMWIYGSGFPKSHNNFGLEGYGTALKPAYEPIIMAMKPLDGTFAQNAEKWGQAGINIDECRIVTGDCLNGGAYGNTSRTKDSFFSGLKPGGGGVFNQPKGRWPANVIFDEEAGKMLDEQSGVSKSSSKVDYSNGIAGEIFKVPNKYKRAGGFSDTGGASRFFYCAKASKSERNDGLSHLEDKIGGGMNATVHGDTRTGRITIQKNNHPTVKPIKLMEYLIKLVMPPKDGILLDPFAGSGTTILAAKRLGVNAIGIEKFEEYAEIARARLENIEKKTEERNLDLFSECI